MLPVEPDEATIQRVSRQDVVMPSFRRPEAPNEFGFYLFARRVDGAIVDGLADLQLTIDAVLLWDVRYPDPSLDPALDERMRAGLTALRNQIGQEADMIRAERASQGLENR